KFIPDVFDEIDIDRKNLIHLTVLLRLAVRIHRGRDFEQIEPLLHIDEDNVLHLEFEDNWLAEHPLSCLDLEYEAKHLDNAGFKLSFK
ncbi:MAG: exopolyphosphatase, partial [Pseudomonadota bacterium]|nr:exopolyphosphatase [Pseudomonadota bacterium]